MSERIRNNISLEKLNEEMKDLVIMIEDIDVDEKTIISRITSIKKDYMYYIKNENMRDSLSEQKLDRLAKIFVGKDFKSTKIFSGMNEIGEMIGDQYAVLAEKAEDEETANRLNKKAFKIHAKILGTEGSKPRKYTAEYLERIIIEKTTQPVIGEDGNVIQTAVPLDNSEILKILKDKIESNVVDYTDTVDLVENVFIQPIRAKIKEKKLDTFTNHQMLDVLVSYARLYKYKNDFNKYGEYLRLALLFKRFEKYPEYQEIKALEAEIPELRKKYEESLRKINENKNDILKVEPVDTESPINEDEFNVISFGNIVSAEKNEVDLFIDKLSILPGFDKLFEDDIPSNPRNIGTGEDKVDNLLTNREKVENIILMLKKLRDLPGFEDANISKCFVRKDIFENLDTKDAESKLSSFDKYIIFPIDGLENQVFLMENFDSKKGGSLYVTNEECLSTIISMKRTHARKYRDPGIVEIVDHDDGYVYNLRSAVVKIHNAVRNPQISSTKQKFYKDRALFIKDKQKEKTDVEIGKTGITASQLRDIITSSDKASKDELFEVIDKLSVRDDREKIADSDAIVIRKTVAMIALRLKLLEKQNAKVEELERLEKAKEELLTIIPE